MIIMKIFIVFVIAICYATGQDVNNNDLENTINSIFNTSFMANYEEVTQEPLKGYGALQQCGENTSQGHFVCVPYYNCDPDTNTVNPTGVFDGFGKIDIRFNEGAGKCSDYLEGCCRIPDNQTETVTTDPGRDHTQFPSRTESPSPGTIGTTETYVPVTPSSRPTVTDNEPHSCGLRNPNGIDFQMTGNSHNEAEYGEFPWMIAVLKTKFNPSSDDHICYGGGSLIAANVVLTGAHIVNKLRASDIKIRAGEWDTQTTNERIPYQERNVIRVIRHENFDMDTLRNNVALLILEKPLTKVASVGTVCLPRQGQNIVSKHCFASGWGKTNFEKSGLYSVILKKIELPVIKHQQCQRWLRKTRLGPSFDLHRSFICAGGEAGKDTCTGDGGSPLVCPDPDNPNRYVQVGIVSWGIGCAEAEVPGVYTNIAEFRSWMDSKLTEELSHNSNTI